MRPPRIRLGMRAMLALVAVCALALLAYGEFRDGLPPRFVYRRMPARIAKLRVGMPRAEVREILGVDRPWYLGGSGPPAAKIGDSGILVRQNYHGMPGGSPIFRLSDDSHAPNSVVLDFVNRSDSNDASDPGPLEQASFCDRSGVVTRMAEMRRGPIRVGGAR